MTQEWTKEKLAAVIDHTLLKAEATAAQIVALCEEAKRYQFASVCVNPVFVELAARTLKGTAVKTCTVIGFPLGAHTTAGKVFETRYTIEQGAREIDMVMHIGSLKGGEPALVEKDIRSVVEAAQGITVKVIIETVLLNEGEKKTACELVMAAGAHYVKTSTGLGPGGATVEDIRFMRRIVGQRLKIKASGGIRTHEQAIAMLHAGADRLGTSSGVAIVEAA